MLKILYKNFDILKKGLYLTGFSLLTHAENLVI